MARALDFDHRVWSGSIVFMLSLDKKFLRHNELDQIKRESDCVTERVRQMKSKADDETNAIWVVRCQVK